MQRSTFAIRSKEAKGSKLKPGLAASQSAGWMRDTRFLPTHATGLRLATREQVIDVRSELLSSRPVVTGQWTRGLRLSRCHRRRRH